MTAQLPQGDRDVVPRWRSVRQTVEAGEFQTRPDRRPLTEPQVEALEIAAAQWRQQPNQVSASELTGAALVSGEREVGADAAAFLARQGATPLLRNLGTVSLAASPTTGLNNLDVSHESLSDLKAFFREQLARQKRRLKQDPRNAIAWADLARRYTALGQFEHAERALSVALSLAPDSRYLMRSAARFYVHIDRPRSAHRLLRDSARTLEDPWLLAALLAVGSVAKVPTIGTGSARRIMADDNFRMIERSELFSEVATFEMRAGAKRKAKDLFRKSLTTPTDNSLAQIGWAAHRLTGFEVRVENVDIPFKDEALARAASQAGDWTVAVTHGLRWLRDQPFDSSAATMASYALSVGLERYEEAANVAEFGLISQPGHPALVNNLAFASIEMGDLTRASGVLASANPSAMELADRVAILATIGLMAFRLGDVEGGRRGYADSISLARVGARKPMEVMGRLMLFREELRAGAPDLSLANLESLKRMARGIEDPGLKDSITRVESIVTSRRASEA